MNRENKTLLIFELQLKAQMWQRYRLDLMCGQIGGLICGVTEVGQEKSLTPNNFSQWGLRGNPWSPGWALPAMLPLLCTYFLGSY